jgi:hypothetical protein
MQEAVCVGLQMGTVATALIAAWFWFRSSRVRISGKAQAFALIGAAPNGEDLLEIARALREQWRHSAVAAMCAAGSALLQGCAILACLR